MPNTPSVTRVLAVEVPSAPNTFGEPSRPQSASLETTPFRDLELVVSQVVNTFPCTFGSRTFASHWNPSVGFLDRPGAGQLRRRVSANSSAGDRLLVELCNEWRLSCPHLTDACE